MALKFRRHLALPLLISIIASFSSLGHAGLVESKSVGSSSNGDKLKTLLSVAKDDFDELKAHYKSDTPVRAAQDEFRGSGDWGCPGEEAAAKIAAVKVPKSFEEYWWRREGELEVCRRWEEAERATIRWIRFIGFLLQNRKNFKDGTFLHIIAVRPHIVVPFHFEDHQPNKVVSLVKIVKKILAEKTLALEQRKEASGIWGKHYWETEAEEASSLVVAPKWENAAACARVEKLVRAELKGDEMAGAELERLLAEEESVFAGIKDQFGDMAMHHQEFGMHMGRLEEERKIRQRGSPTKNAHQKEAMERNFAEKSKKE